ncbi:SinI family restriction endonuclease [Lyngbya aestuarii]|uniref:SinI family restriction endonuclease n=1 Tax=Lyngbya aestuarii TaxID=118322 RepID=UPI00403D91FA
MSKQVPKFEPTQIISRAERIVKANSSRRWDTAIQTVLYVCCRLPELCPNLGKTELFSEEYLTKWLNKYFQGYDQRPSKRVSKKIGTVPDEIINLIISTRLPSLDQQEITAINFAHRLSMSAENILGLLLEEYLAEKLLPYGWYCCWGGTMKSIDFCTKNYDLLQIKNRSNSENSSSSKVRQGTQIKKWHRVNAITGSCYWDKLNSLVGCRELSESDFSLFVRKVITNNPDAVYIEIGNIWKNSTNN